MTLYNFVEASCYQLQVGHKKQEESIQWLNLQEERKKLLTYNVISHGVIQSYLEQVASSVVPLIIILVCFDHPRPLASKRLQCRQRTRLRGMAFVDERINN